jgi:hypothetical protein
MFLIRTRESTLSEVPELKAVDKMDGFALREKKYLKGKSNRIRQ